MSNITIEDLQKVELRVGTILNCELVEGSDKLLKLTVDFGEEKPRTVLTGMKLWYGPDHFRGKQFVFCTNLEPRPMMGMVSEGMILACGEEKPIIIKPSKPVVAGSKIR